MLKAAEATQRVARIMALRRSLHVKATLSDSQKHLESIQDHGTEVSVQGPFSSNEFIFDSGVNEPPWTKLEKIPENSAVWQRCRRETPALGRTKFLKSHTEEKTALHLYRALLRQASYLPDPASQKYFKAHLSSRFHDYRSHPRTQWVSLKGFNTQSNKNAAASIVSLQPPTRADIRTERKPQLLAQARQELRFLQTANAGHPGHLKKVLELTYGRRGKRKHELLKALGAPKPNPMTSEELEKLSEAIRSESQSSTSPPAPKLALFTDKFSALVKSQMQQKHEIFTKPQPRSAAPLPPEKNSWGRPLPVKRSRNLTQKWYAQTLDRLMPPLPEAEWNQLGDLATGRMEWPGRLKRRAKGSGQWDEEILSISTQDKSVLRNEHILTPRYMRRMWANVWAQCPIMSWNNDRQKWEVQWGQAGSQKGLVLSASRSLGSSPFEGVDENGKVVKEGHM